MTRETKVGLVVAGSFVCLVGVVVAARWRNGDDMQISQAVSPQADADKKKEPGKDGKAADPKKEAEFNPFAPPPLPGKVENKNDISFPALPSFDPNEIAKKATNSVNGVVDDAKKKANATLQAADDAQKQMLAQLGKQKDALLEKAPMLPPAPSFEGFGEKKVELTVPGAKIEANVPNFFDKKEPPTPPPPAAVNSDPFASPMPLPKKPDDKGSDLFPPAPAPVAKKNPEPKKEVAFDPGAITPPSVAPPTVTPPSVAPPTGGVPDFGSPAKPMPPVVNSPSVSSPTVAAPKVDLPQDPFAAPKPPQPPAPANNVDPFAPKPPADSFAPKTPAPAPADPFAVKPPAVSPPSVSPPSDPFAPKAAAPADPFAAKPNPLPLNPSLTDSKIPPLGSEPKASPAITGPAFTAPAVTVNPPANPNLPKMKSFDVAAYVCKPGDTSFDVVSRAFFQSDKYGKALEQFNRENGMVNQSFLAPGMKVLVPPAEILQTRYPTLIGASFAGAGSPFTPTSSSPPPISISPPVGLNAGPAAVKGPITPTSDATKRYRVAPQGQMIIEIAMQTLGDGRRWSEIYRLNPQLRPEAPIPGGTEIRLPMAANVP